LCSEGAGDGHLWGDYDHFHGDGDLAFTGGGRCAGGECNSSFATGYPQRSSFDDVRAKEDQPLDAGTEALNLAWGKKHMDPVRKAEIEAALTMLAVSDWGLLDIEVQHSCTRRNLIQQKCMCCVCEICQNMSVKVGDDGRYQPSHVECAVHKERDMTAGYSFIPRSEFNEVFGKGIAVADLVKMGAVEHSERRGDRDVKGVIVYRKEAA
jgi:hypothetical protein